MAAHAIAAGNTADRGSSPRARAAGRTILIASLAWAALILALYFDQLWKLIAAGPQIWRLGRALDALQAIELTHAREAAVRALSGIASAAVVVAALLGSGFAVDRWLTPPRLAAHERLVVRFANGAAILSTVLLLAALAGAYRPEVVRAVAGTLALYAIAASMRATRHRPRISGVRAAITPELLPWIVVTTLAVLLAFATALAPETEYDALWYHLELPRRWLAARRLTDDVHDYISLYPGAWELIFGVALAFDGSVAARLLHWCTLGASAAICGSIGTRVLGSRSGWIAAAIFVSAPTVLWEATTAYIDLALALHGAVAVSALWLSTRDPDPRVILLAGLHFGLACATKHLGLVIAAIAIGCYIAARLRSGPPIRLARTVAILSLLTILLPSPWYLRAWVASGNPVFPELYTILGAEPADRWNDVTEQELTDFKQRFGPPRTLANLAALPWDMTMHSWRYGGTFGPFLLLLVPAVGAVVWKECSARWLLGGVVAYVLVWASPVSSFQLRFLLPAWVFASALIGAGIELVARASGNIWRPGSPLVHMTLGAIALLNLPPFTPLHERDREGWERWLTHVVHRVPIPVVAGATAEDEYLCRHIRSYDAWQFLNEHVQPDARVLTFLGGDHFYANRERLRSEAPAARAATWDAPDATSALEALDRLRITHVLVPVRAPARTAKYDRVPLLQPDVTSRFRVVFEDYWTIVYRVPTRTSPASRDQRYGR